jgi:hypothetical protein
LVPEIVRDPLGRKLFLIIIAERAPREKEGTSTRSLIKSFSFSRVNSEIQKKVNRACSFSAQRSFYHHEIQLSEFSHTFSYSSSPICSFYARAPCFPKENAFERKKERKKERSEVKEEDKNEEPFSLKIRKKEQTRESF